MSAVSLGAGPRGSPGVGGWLWRPQLSFQAEKGQARLLTSQQSVFRKQGFLHAISASPPSSPAALKMPLLLFCLRIGAPNRGCHQTGFLPGRWRGWGGGRCGNCVLDSSLSMAPFPAPLHGCGSEAFFFLRLLLRGSSKTRMWARSSAPAAGQGTGLGARAET